MKFACYDTAGTIREKSGIYLRRKEAFEEDPRFHHAYVDLVSNGNTPSGNTLRLRMLMLACRLRQVQLVVLPHLDALAMEESDLVSALEALSDQGIYVSFDTPVSADPKEDGREEPWQIRNRIEGDLLIAAITMDNCYTRTERGIPFVTMETDAEDLHGREPRVFADVLEESGSGFFAWLPQPGCWFYVNRALAAQVIAAAQTFWDSITEELFQF